MQGVLESRAEGVAVMLDESRQELRVDLARPGTMTVRACDSVSGLEKTYILKVTHRGLCLV